MDTSPPAKLLVIDDEEWLREMVRMALTDRGYLVLEAADGATGIEMARRELPDLVLCDVRMERVDGYLALARLREDPKTAGIPFILMTGMADAEGMRHGMELGADDYLPKPFTLDALFAAVEARLKKARLAREQAEASLTALRDNISLMLPHEMLTPLNGMLPYAELLETAADSLSPAEIAEMGGTIKASTLRLLGLVNHFLTYVRLEIAAADPAQAAALRAATLPDAEAVIGGQARQVAQAAGREADLRLKLVPATLPMTAGHLATLVHECVENAAKFSPPGTAIEVALHLDEIGRPRLSITDGGAGLTPEQIASIGAYMQFGRRTREQQGAGLGLIIARRICELHGARLEISSEPGKGAEVRVLFPPPGQSGSRR